MINEVLLCLLYNDKLNSLIIPSKEGNNFYSHYGVRYISLRSFITRRKGKKLFFIKSGVHKFPINVGFTLKFWQAKGNLNTFSASDGRKRHLKRHQRYTKN